MSELFDLPASIYDYCLGGEGERKVAYDPVEPRPLVALRLAVDFILAGTELAKVFGGTGDEVLVELEGDTA